MSAVCGGPVRVRVRAASVFGFALFLSGCTSPVPLPEGDSTRVPAAPPGFVNKVWMVDRSPSVARGQLYVFLSEGTLVIASSTGTPSFGKWSDEGGMLTMVEEGIPYKVDVVELTDDMFSIRINNPGPPVEMTMVPAEVPPRSK